MTRKAGHIRIPLSNKEARQVAQSIHRLHRQTRKGTLLTGGPRSLLKHLALHLRRLSIYERKFAEIPRKEALDIVLSADALIASMSARRGQFGLYYAPIIEFSRRCKKALTRRGAPGLTTRQAELQANNKGYDERGRRRLKKRVQLDRWVEEVHKCGETLLTSTLPPP